MNKDKKQAEITDATALTDEQMEQVSGGSIISPAELKTTDDELKTSTDFSTMPENEEIDEVKAPMAKRLYD